MHNFEDVLNFTDVDFIAGRVENIPRKNVRWLKDYLIAEHESRRLGDLWFLCETVMRLVISKHFRMVLTD